MELRLPKPLVRLDRLATAFVFKVLARPTYGANLRSGMLLRLRHALGFLRIVIRIFPIDGLPDGLLERRAGHG